MFTTIDPFDNGSKTFSGLIGAGDGRLDGSVDIVDGRGRGGVASLVVFDGSGNSIRLCMSS